MFLRFVQAKVLPDRLNELRRVYEETVIPTLQRTKGCLYASLIQSVDRTDECISMTLWQGRESAEEYERSGAFGKLIEEAAPFLASSSDWSIRLSEDMKVVYEPVPEVPKVAMYDLAESKNGAAIAGAAVGSLYVRIVAPKIHPGKVDEFRKLYNQEIAPEIRKAPGCRYASLSENLKEHDQILSVTIWNTQNDAEEYEQSGLFRDLTRKVEHTFSEVYQWKMQLERKTHRRTVTSDEMTVNGYSVLTGRSFL